MATEQEITQVLREMSSLPNSPDMSSRESARAVVAMYARVLSDMTLDVLEVAVSHYISTSTFFPTPGALRSKAMELWILAAQIPTAAEAWGQVLMAVKFRDSVWCNEGARLRNCIDGLTGREYWEALNAYHAHNDNCHYCKQGGFVEEYAHPTVGETVRLLGGRDLLFTDNASADRARFIEAFKDVISRETLKAGLTTEVREFVKEQRATLEAGEQIGRLTARLEK